MTRARRIELGLAFVCVGFFCFHWFSILVYVSGAKTVNQSLGGVPVDYTRPLFRQGWRLFAPEPAKYSKRLSYRCRVEGGDWSGWKNALAPLLREHYAKRVTYHGKLLRIPLELMSHLHQEMARIEHEMPCKDGDSPCLLRRDEALRQTRTYLETQRFSKESCEDDLRESGQKLVEVQFESEAVYPRPYEQRNDPSVRPTMSQYEFEPFEVPP